MGATTVARNTPVMGAGGVPVKTSYPIADNVLIPGGTLVCVDSSGRANPAADTAGFVTVGISLATYDNTIVGHSAGAFSVEVQQGVARWVNGSSTSVNTAWGTLAYVSDNQTVVTSGTSHAIIAGTIYLVDSQGVWVYSGLAAPVDATTLTAFIANLAAVTTAEGASLVGIEDAGGFTSQTTVEGATQELYKHTLGLGIAPQALSGAGACNVTSLVTLFTSTGAAQALTLANGTQTGQLKVVHHTVDGGSGVLTPTTAGNFATFTLTNVHDACLLQWSGTAWNILLSAGGTIA